MCMFVCMCGCAVPCSCCSVVAAGARIRPRLSKPHLPPGLLQDYNQRLAKRIRHEFAIIEHVSINFDASQAAAPCDRKALCLKGICR